MHSVSCMGMATADCVLLTHNSCMMAMALYCSVPVAITSLTIMLHAAADIY